MERTRYLLGCAAWVIAAAVGVSLGSPASAQSDPSVPPIRSTVDSNGIDLQRDIYVGMVTDLTIGPNGPHGLQDTWQYLGFWRHANVPRIVGSGGSLTVTFDAQSYEFTWDATSNSWKSDNQDGSTLSADHTVFTARDGMVINFGAGWNYSFFEMSYPDSLGSKVTFPDGTTWTFHYDSFSGCSQCSHYSSAIRLTSITSSTGYQLKFSYRNTYLHYLQVLPTDDMYWLDLIKVTAIDNNVEYCDPGYLPCSLSNAWPYVAYGKNGYDNIVDAEDSDGNNWIYNYDTSDRLTGIQRPGSSVNDPTFTYTGTGSQVASVTTGGHSWVYSLGSGTSTATLKNSSGATVSSRVISFDSTTQQLLSDADKDAAGNVLSQTSYAYCTTSDTNCPVGMLKSVTAPNGATTTFNHDTRGNITHTSTTPAGGGTAITTSASYPSSCTNAFTCNEPASTTDGMGYVTNYSYDATSGLVTQIQKPAPSGTGTRPTTTFTYETKQAYYKNSAGSIVASGAPIHLLTATSTCQTLSSCVGTADEARTTIDYGPQTAGTGNNLLPVSVTKKSGSGSVSATTAYSYDNVGNLISVDGPLSGTADTTTYRYDAERRLVGTISADPDGTGALERRAKRVTYNGDGTVAKVEIGTVTGTNDTSWSAFASKQQLTTSYDAYARKTRDVTSAGGTTYGVTDYSYDNVGRLDCTTQRMNPATWGTVTAACTAQTAGSAGPDRITRDGYDALGRVTSVTSAYGQSYATIEKASYTASGKTASVIDGDNNKTTYIYDGFDRLSKTEYPSATKGAGTSSTTDYEQLGYDANGNITSRRLRDGTSIAYTYDHLDRLTYKNLPGSELDVTYGYDLLDRPTSVSQSGNALSFTYDALGWLLTQAGPQGTLTSTWDAGGRRTKLQWPDGFYVNYDYDTLNEMTKVRENGATSGVGVLASYSYDNLGNRTGATYGNGTSSTWTPDAVSRLSSLVQNLAGTSYDLTKTFSYNPASQIASETSSNTAYAWNAAANVNRNYTTNGLNQYTASGGTALGYDARGNLTTSGADGYSYTSENLLKTGPGSTSLSYDPLLRLYQVTQGATTTRFAYDGLEMVAEYNGSNALQHRYVFGPGTDEPIVQYSGTGTSNRNWLVSDERGSVIALTDNSGNKVAINSYDEYGIPGTANSGRYQFTGQTWIPEVGLFYYKARMYSPSLGRFMQADPIGYADGLNWYSYVAGDPINSIDPTGNAPDILVCGGVLAYGVCFARAIWDNILETVFGYRPDAPPNNGTAPPTNPSQKPEPKPKPKPKKSPCFSIQDRRLNHDQYVQKEAARLRAAGYEVATEVSLFVFTPTGNTRARADIIARIPGSNIYAIHEIKTGNAQLTGNQSIVYNAGLAIVKGNNGLPVGLGPEDFLPISEYGVVRCPGL